MCRGEERETERDRKTDRETDKQTDRQTDRQTDSSMTCNVIDCIKPQMNRRALLHDHPNDNTTEEKGE